AKKAAEARAYRKWAAKSASRAFELEHIDPDELDVYGIDPGRVTWSGKAAAPQGADLDRIADECSAALRRAAPSAIDCAEHARDQLATGARAPAEPRLETELATATAAVAKVAQTRLTEVAEVLAKGVERGAAPQQLAKELRGVLDDRKWADTVAVTETARA